MSILISGSLFKAYKNFGLTTAILSIYILLISTFLIIRPNNHGGKIDTTDYLILGIIMFSCLLFSIKFNEIYSHSLNISKISKFIAFDISLLMIIILRKLTNTFSEKLKLLKIVIYSFIPIIVYGYISFLTEISKKNLFIELLKLNRQNFCSIYGHYNYYSIILLLLTPVTLGLALISKNKKEKIFLYIYSGIITLSMFLTFSRGGWLSLIVSILIFLFILIKNKKYKLILIVIVLVAILISYLVLAKISSSKELLNPITLIIRLEGNLYAIQHFLQNPSILLLGYGFDLSYSPMAKVVSKGMGIPFIHNTYLYIIAEMGLPFLLLLIATIIYSIMSQAKVFMKSNNEERILSIVFFSIMGGLFVRVFLEVVWPVTGSWYQIVSLFIILFSILTARSENEKARTTGN